MNIITILLYAHSGIRWLIILAALLALGIFGYGWIVKKTFPKLGRILPAAYSGLLDAQVLLGLIFMIWTGLAGSGFPRFRWEHMAMMILAAVVAHLPSRWAKAGKENLYRNIFFAILGSLVLIYLGVLVLPGGWTR
ncbi:MAG: hypothetical protein HN390_16440 [Anaerolineae bacterium]|jgi:hypothetical protein|nr:hypothetical protein [Anaerolineae bacterium]MBT7073973.1 hypothetical protein [Anaerolineae bacterium]MBT7988505.1 hypothetical protein [Anaerolineae bacterium]